MVPSSLHLIIDVVRCTGIQPRSRQMHDPSVSSMVDKHTGMQSHSKEARQDPHTFVDTYVNHAFSNPYSLLLVSSLSSLCAVVKVRCAPY